jgi:hypothetical protein
MQSPIVERNPPRRGFYTRAHARVNVMINRLLDVTAYVALALVLVSMLAAVSILVEELA